MGVVHFIDYHITDLTSREEEMRNEVSEEGRAKNVLRLLYHWPATGYMDATRGCIGFHGILSKIRDGHLTPNEAIAGGPTV